MGTTLVTKCCVWSHRNWRGSAAQARHFVWAEKSSPFYLRARKCKWRCRIWKDYARRSKPLFFTFVKLASGGTRRAALIVERNRVSHRRRQSQIQSHSPLRGRAYRSQSVSASPSLRRRWISFCRSSRMLTKRFIAQNKAAGIEWKPFSSPVGPGRSVNRHRHIKKNEAQSIKLESPPRVI